MGRNAWSLRDAPPLWVAGFTAWFGLTSYLHLARAKRWRGDDADLAMFVTLYLVTQIVIALGANVVRRQCPGVPTRVLQVAAIALVALTLLPGFDLPSELPAIFRTASRAGLVIMAAALGWAAIAAHRPIGWAVVAVALAPLSWGALGGDVVGSWWLRVIINAATAVAFIGAAAMLRPDDGATPLPPARATTT